jgi:hypothetical protein
MCLRVSFVQSIIGGVGRIMIVNTHISRFDILVFIGACARSSLKRR